jgi:hypothetical protein
MQGKNIVRMSPALLGRIGETANGVTEGSLVRGGHACTQRMLFAAGACRTDWCLRWPKPAAHSAAHLASPAPEVRLHLQIVQFVGTCTHYNQDLEWHVTHAILSNSLAVSSNETRAQRNEQVDDVMRKHALTHIGWLRQASVNCPLSTLDLDTQRVRFCAPGYRSPSMQLQTGMCMSAIAAQGPS